MNKRKLFQSKNYNAKNETKSSKFNLSNFENKNYSKSKKQAGITLIALVISIIVMLILAGVSLNATIGDNGIITQAQNATYMQSIATLEEYLNNFYVEHYDDFNNEENKVQAMSKYNTSRDWFYQPMTGLGYIVDSSGNIHYFINKANLPTEIKNQLKGGDAGSGTYADYARMNDVYGVTTDLKVYYCANGNDSKMGAEESVKDKLDRKVFDSTNGIATYLKETFPDIIKTDENGNILLENLNVIQELDLDANENPNINFSDFYNFTSLKIVKLYNYNNVSLNGFQNLALLERLYIENSDISDYSAINNLSTLTHLYLLKSNNANVEKMSSALANSNLPNLKYFGIMNSDLTNRVLQQVGSDTSYSEVTDLSSLKRISETTKNAIKYLWLNNNKINNLCGIEGFKNVYQIEVINNPNLQNINEIKEFKEIKYFYAQYCNLENIEGLINSNIYLLSVFGNTNLTSLNGLQGSLNINSIYANNCNLQDITAIQDKNSLEYLNLNNNLNLKLISSIKNDTAIRKLYLGSNNNMEISEVRQIANIIKNCMEIDLPSKYYAVLEGASRREYRNLNLNDNSDEILALEGDTICTELSLEGNSNLGTTESSKQKLYQILGSMTNLKALQLRGLKNIDNMEWIKTMPNLVELDLRGTAVTDLTLLNTYATKLETLVIDNENIELSDIQTTIERLGDNSYDKSLLNKSNNQCVLGLQITNQKLANKLTSCTELTRFIILPLDATNGIKYDLSMCSKMTNFSEINCSEILFVFPENIEYVYLGYSRTTPDLSKCKKIQEFYYEDPRNLTEENLYTMFSNLSNCTNLKKAIIPTSWRNSNNIKGIEKLANTKIESLKLSGAYNQSWSTGSLQACLSDITGIGKLKTLKELKLDITSIKNLDALAGCESLETLTMQYGQLNDISGIANCTNLKAINFSGDNQIQHSIIYNLEPLSNLTNLEVANFNYNSINNLHGIENLQKLRVLSLNNNAITNYVSTNNGQINNLEILANLNKYSLRELYLNNNKIDDFSILKNITNWSNKSGW